MSATAAVPAHRRSVARPAAGLRGLEEHPPPSLPLSGSVDAHGLPVRAPVTAGTIAGSSQVLPWIDGIAAEHLASLPIVGYAPALPELAHAQEPQSLATRALPKLPPVLSLRQSWLKR